MPELSGSLLTILRQCDWAEPSSADVATLQSTVAMASQQDLAVALDEFMDVAPLLESIADRFETNTEGLSDLVLKRLVSAMLLDPQFTRAEHYAGILLARREGDWNAHRLWVLAAAEPAEAFRRLRSTDLKGEDAERLRVWGRDYLGRLGRQDLAKALDS